MEIYPKLYEGRKLCIALYWKYLFKKDILKNSLTSNEIRTLCISFLKTNFNFNKNLYNLFTQEEHNNLFFNLGFYNGAIININCSPKYSLVNDDLNELSSSSYIFNWKKIKEFLDYFKNFKERREKKRGKIDFLSLLLNDYKIYRRKTVLIKVPNTLINHQKGKENNLEEITYEKLRGTIILFFKFLFNKDCLLKGQECLEMLKKKVSNFKNSIGDIKINAFYFLSYDWFDLAILFLINPENKELDLTELLKNFKRGIVGDSNNTKIFFRTETDIFIHVGLLKKENIKIPLFPIFLRVGSHFLKNFGYSQRIIINKLKECLNNDSRKFYDIKLLFGIRDLYLQPLSKSEKKSLLTLSDFFKFIECIRNLKENNVSLFSDIQIIPAIDV